MTQTMTRIIRLFFLTVAVATLLPAVAQAHFLWLVRGADNHSENLHLYFSELAEADDPDLLDRVADVRVWQLGSNGKLKELNLDKRSESLTTKLAPDAAKSIFVLSHDLGVISRGGETFLLRYYAKTGPALGVNQWQKIDCGKQLTLDLIPRRDGDKVSLTVKWRGKPLKGAQLKASGPGIDDFEAISDENGQATFTIGDVGLYSIRARYIQAKGGTIEGEEYASTRHYSTLALNISNNDSASHGPQTTTTASNYPKIPEMVTSFGAAIVDDALYVYGGHTGRAHSYDKDAQARTLRRLDLKNPIAWKSLGNGPGLQGLAMVAHAGKLYRIGGFTAKNEQGEDHDLWSQADVSCYDPATKQWTDMPPLPEPRSSFDAAVLGDKIYVIGGWQMSGPEEKHWHKTAYVLDLSSDAPQWEAFPEPTFQRRALSLAAHDGKIYAIGGMRKEGGPTTRVDIFDPAKAEWSQGPSLQGEQMDGFGSSAFATGGRLYVSTYSGKLQRLANNPTSWELVKQLERDRFFHRMLPLSANQLLCVGGASMSRGKFEEVDVIDLLSSPPTTNDVSAADLLFRARRARAIWINFPGFTADISVSIDGESQSGKLNVDDQGEVTLSGVEWDHESDVIRSLKSLVSHRMGEAEFTQNVSYADDETDHSLGRLISLDYDSTMASSYRVKDDMICQVNREMGAGRFTISVFSVHRNKEGKILPNSYNVCFWNEDGALSSSTTVREDWTRVGSFDLPSSHMSVTASKGSYTNVRFIISNHELSKPEQ